MTIRTTRWKPDTCKCVLEYEWDDTQEDPTFTIKTVANKCKDHSGISVDKALYDTVLAENQMKNFVHKEIFDNTPTAVEEVIDVNGDTIKRIKPGKAYNWSFDTNRKLVVDLAGFTQDEKDSVEGYTNTEFPNLVEIG